MNTVPENPVPETPVPETPAPANYGLDDRYGRKRDTSRRNRRLIICTAVAFALAFAVWVAWVGMFSSSGSLEATTTGHTIIDDHNVSVSFQINSAPGEDVSCALQALNESYSIVGWKVVSIPASSDRTRSFTDNVRTTELGNTGLIYRCWLT